MTLARTRLIISKILLFTAYMTVILQWLWLTIIVIPPLIENGAFDGITLSSSETAPSLAVEPIELSGPSLWLIGGITAAILILTVVVLVRLPKTVLDTSEAIVHKTTDAVTPIVTHRAKLPEKKQRVVSRRVRLGLQLAASVVPFTICVFLPSVNGLTREIIITMALCMVIMSVACFVFAWLIEPTKAISRTRSRASRG